MSEKEPKAPKESKEISDAQKDCEAGGKPTAYDIANQPIGGPKMPKPKNPETRR